MSVRERKVQVKRNHTFLKLTRGMRLANTRQFIKEATHTYPKFYVQFQCVNVWCRDWLTKVQHQSSQAKL